VFTTNLLLAEYFVAFSNFMLATAAALVVGKAVLVANAMPLLRRYDRAPLAASCADCSSLRAHRSCSSIGGSAYASCWI
jgi:hypothetical protein